MIPKELRHWHIFWKSAGLLRSSWKPPGGYEQRALRHLSARNLSVAIVNPRRVRAFARARDRLPIPALAGGARETDRINAHNLAHFAQVVQPHPQPSSSEAKHQLAGLIARRRQLHRMLTAERNRLRNAHPTLHQQLQDHIDWLRQALKQLDADMETLLHSEQELKERADLLQSAAAVGLVTAGSLEARKERRRVKTDRVEL